MCEQRYPMTAPPPFGYADRLGFYSRIVFPRLLDWMMSAEKFGEIRRRLLAGVRGETLEIGFGTGLNLGYYPEKVHRLTTVDINAGMHRIAKPRIAGAAIPVRSSILDGQSLPFEDESFDSVVSTWTLCSISNAGAALGELRRVLKPDGRFYFVEHGRSPDPGVAKWQARLTPLQKKIADGCHLDRDVRHLVESSGFRIENIENFYMEGVPRIGGYLYFGSATRES